MSPRRPSCPHSAAPTTAPFLFRNAAQSRISLEAIRLVLGAGIGLNRLHSADEPILKLPFHGNPELDEQFDVKLYEHSRSGSASIPRYARRSLPGRHACPSGCQERVGRGLPRSGQAPLQNSSSPAGIRPLQVAPELGQLPAGQLKISGAQGLAVELAAKPDACKIDAVGS